MTRPTKMPIAAILFPPLAIVFVVVAPLLAPEAAPSLSPPSLGLSSAMIVIMVGTVFAAVHHAEVIAHRTGQPLGTLVLTLSVTVIEVALIASMMLAPDSDQTLARDTVFSVIMIVCNGLVGLCVVIGGVKYREQEFQVSGTGVYLNIIGALALLTLVLPNYTLTMPGPFYSDTQLVFVSAVTLVLYAVFLFIQTVRHADYFRSAEGQSHGDDGRPAMRIVVASLVLLIAALGGVILIAKKFAVVVGTGLHHAGAPEAVTGIVVAMLVLAPESIAAVTAARRDVLQKSLNLALGSSLATIGLTVPAIAAIAIALGRPVVLGLGARDTLLLALTLFSSILTFGTGRTNILSGLIHLVVFATFLFLLFVP